MNPKQQLILQIEDKKRQLIFQIQDCHYQFKSTVEQKIIICDQWISYSYKFLHYLNKDNTNQHCKISKVYIKTVV